MKCWERELNLCMPPPKMQALTCSAASCDFEQMCPHIACTNERERSLCERVGEEPKRQGKNFRLDYV